MIINKEDGTISIEGLYGVTVLYMPVEYMIPNAPEENIAVLNHFKAELDKIEQNGGIGTLILPAIFDESGNRLFELVQPNITIVNNYSGE